MSIATIDDQATVREATELLFKHLPPSKVARLMMLWRVGSGDYVEERSQFFKGETVDNLFAQAKAFEKPVPRRAAKRR